jgi:phosphate transport system substrate-binding protein
MTARRALALSIVLTASLACADEPSSEVGEVAVVSPPVDVPEDLAPYEMSEKITGEVVMAGEGDLADLASLWARAFVERQPAVRVAVERADSLGGAELFASGRELSDDDLARRGLRPLAVARDGAAVYVHRDNPVREMSVAELDAALAVRLVCQDRTPAGPGFSRPARRWGDLGLGPPWQARPIEAVSQGGVGPLLADRALCGGTTRNNLRRLDDPDAVVAAVSEAPAALGVGGLGHETEAVRAVPLAPRAGGPAVAPTVEAVRSGQYPLSRTVWLYVIDGDARPLPPAARELARFALSREGQEIVARSGLVPLDGTEASRGLERLDGRPS